MNYQYLIVGGGIAGVSCAEELSQLSPTATITLISGSHLIKAVTNFTKRSNVLEEFKVEEKPLSYITQLCPNVTVQQAKLLSINATHKTVRLSDGVVLKYDKLCLCTGAMPAVIARNHPLVLGIRDMESACKFQEKLQQARRIVVVGNGGIATEIVYELKGCEVVWAIKDDSIGRTFFDEGAATFFLPHLASKGASCEEVQTEEEGGVLEISPLKRTKYALDKKQKDVDKNKETMGGALGPDWHSDLKMTGKAFDEKYRHVHVEYKCEVKELITNEEVKIRGISPTQFPLKQRSQEAGPGEKSEGDIGEPRKDVRVDEKGWPLYVVLTNGVVFGCDLVVSATGVTPSIGDLEVEGGKLDLAEDGGVRVDKEMRTSVPDVYAAGDVCSVEWGHHSPLWFQMRLWTQARQMGSYAGKCISAHSSGESMMLDFCFEVFTHVTSFFGYKVVLLGLYNGQTLGNDYEVLLRYTKGVEYVKVVLKEGRMMGTVLIGETDLEETFENLILDRNDLSQYGDSLLDPDVDIEDYFD